MRLFVFLSILSILAACGGTTDDPQREPSAGGTGADVGAGGSGSGIEAGSGSCEGTPPLCGDTCGGNYPAFCADGEWACLPALDFPALDCVDPCGGGSEPPICVNGEWACYPDDACPDAGSSCSIVDSICDCRCGSESSYVRYHGDCSEVDGLLCENAVRYEACVPHHTEPSAACNACVATAGYCYSECAGARVFQNRHVAQSCSDLDGQVCSSDGDVLSDSVELYSSCIQI
jgi:hypothetical protein